MNRHGASSNSCRGTGKCTSVATAGFLVAATLVCPSRTLARGSELDRHVVFDIPAQSVESALVELSRQAHIQIVIVPEVSNSAPGRQLRAKISTREALNEILKGSGYKYTEVGSTISIEPMVTGTESGEGNSRTGAFDDHAETADHAAPERSRRSSESQSDVGIVVVTAQKRTERLQDVPVPVAVVDAKEIAESHQLRLQDYYSTVPGLNYTPNGNGGGSLTIRGLNSGGGNPTVSVLVDGLPFGSSSLTGNAVAVPDLDPSDLRQIEVLRGPQGVLYGASGLGGMINFVTTEPTLGRLSGRLQADAGGVFNGDGANYGGRGAVNVPIGSTLALRASMFARHDAGFIQNVQSGERGVNSADVAGGRISALWRPSDDASLQAGALLQNSNTHGQQLVNLAPPYGDLQQDFLRGSGWSHSSIQDYTLTGKAKVAGFELTSLSAYNVSVFNNSGDFGFAIGAFTEPLFGSSAAAVLSYSESRKFSEELRLEAKIGNQVDWLIGTFYTHETTPDAQYERVAEASTGATDLGTFGSFVWSSVYEEYAAFTDMTLHITNSFDLQLGARESYNKQHYQEVDSGPFLSAFNVGLESPAVYPPEHTSQSAFTYLITPRYRISTEHMLYVRAASGYRPGGPNYNDLGTFASQVPPSFGSDKTQDYEIGAKGSVGGLFTYDASLYYVDWKNIQLALICESCGFINYTGNAGRAKSKGAEITVDIRPARGLDLSAWVSFNRASLTKGFPSTSAAFGVSGDPLPFSSRFSGNVSLRQDFSVGSEVSAFLGGVVSYVGERRGGFLSPPPDVNPRQEFPAYAKVDLRVGIKWKAWTASAFVNNIADRRGLISGGAGTNYPTSFVIVQPRTIGLSVSEDF